MLIDDTSIERAKRRQAPKMSPSLKIADWKSWRPAEYYQEYCHHQVEADDRAAIRFQVEFLRRARAGCFRERWNTGVARRSCGRWRPQHTWSHWTWRIT